MSERVQTMAIFGLLFAIVGYVLPPLATRILPGSFFISVEQPVEVNKPVYAACEPMQLIVYRRSIINATIDSTLELTLMEDGAERDIAVRRKVANVDASKKKLTVDWQIPCDAPGGEYFITGIVSFRVNGQDKIYPLRTVNFSVFNGGIN